MSRTHRKFFVISLLVFFAARETLLAQKIQLVRVTSKQVERTTELPGEFFPFQTVQLHAKVAGYVEKVHVDRGSFVKRGQMLVELSAPEMLARITQAESQITAAEAEKAQAEAQLQAAESTFERTTEAAKTPGVVAGNDLVQAEKQTEAARSLVNSRRRAVESFRANLKSLEDLASYLQVTAPFDGVITTRYVHPGALVGPGADIPLLQLDKISHLRLTVAVPEADAGGIVKGARVEFKVPAYPARTFSGVVARPAYALDMKTRTMPVELDVMNPQHLLAPGMYPSVLWPVERGRPSLLVPATSIVTTTERVFVIRNDDGRAEWVDVRRGPNVGDLVEVYGDLEPGDEIVQRGTDEIRDGSPLGGS
jgi:membrane fusion protein, multidrug efflux system